MTASWQTAVDYTSAESESRSKADTVHTADYNPAVVSPDYPALAVYTGSATVHQ